ncbi:MAG TPA: Chromate resistance protein ChrB [Actinomycetes bacterium]|jgi:hypothetical protein|nr:Chromate resistance protein ChrB [Actinomycetes bacterium]
MRWVLLLVHLPTEPSRHRVAVWRELRRLGALSIGPGAWAVPAVAAFTERIQRAIELAGRGDGEVLVLDAAAHDEATAARLAALFTQAREAEWTEFTTECDRFEAEIAKEIRIGKLTLAELEEEEQSLERLRRWWRDLKTRDVFALPAAVAAELRLKACIEALEDYAERVYQAVHEPSRRQA